MPARIAQVYSRAAERERNLGGGRRGLRERRWATRGGRGEATSWKGGASRGKREARLPWEEKGAVRDLKWLGTLEAKGERGRGGERRGYPASEGLGPQGKGGRPPGGEADKVLTTTWVPGSGGPVLGCIIPQRLTCPCPLTGCRFAAADHRRITCRRQDFPQARLFAFQRQALVG